MSRHAEDTKKIMNKEPCCMTTSLTIIHIVTGYAHKDTSLILIEIVTFNIMYLLQYEQLSGKDFVESVSIHNLPNSPQDEREVHNDLSYSENWFPPT